MTWTRVFLVLEGLLFAIVGGTVLLGPAAAAKSSEIVLTSPGANIEFMASVGGFALGYGAFLIWCAVRKAYVPAGLLSIVFAIGACAGGRLLGLATQGAAPPFQSQMLWVELASVALALLFLRHVMRSARIG